MAINIFVYAVVALLLFYLKLKFFKSRVERMLMKIPGPPYNLFIGNILRLRVKREDLYKTILDICNEHPKSPLVRLWIANKPRVFITKAEAAEVLMSNSNQIVKGDTYKLVSDWLHDGLIMASGSKWFHRRRMITPTFHFKILDQFREIMNEQSAIFVNKIAENGSEYFNVSNYLTRCTLDVLIESAMGVKLECQTGNAGDYLGAIMGIGDIFMQRIFKFWLRNNFIFHNLSEAGRDQKRYLKLLHGFTRNVINERKAQFKKEKAMKKQEENAEEEDMYGRKRRLAFLDMLLEAQDKDNAIDDDGIQEEVDMFLFAGHDTTAAATGWILWNLGHHPEVQEKLIAELDSVLGVDDIDNVSMEQVNQLKYLEYTIKESLRMRNTVPLYSRHITQDMNICGYDIPAGVDVGFLPQLIHDDPNHWPQPEKFDPDRFLPENAANRHPYAYVPFSAGPRNCVGQRFAITELKTLVAHIVHRYEITSKHKKEEMDLLAEFILRPAQGVWIQTQKRRRDY